MIKVIIPGPTVMFSLTPSTRRAVRLQYLGLQTGTRAFSPFNLIRGCYVCMSNELLNAIIILLCFLFQHYYHSYHHYTVIHHTHDKQVSKTEVHLTSRVSLSYTILSFFTQQLSVSQYSECQLLSCLNSVAAKQELYTSTITMVSKCLSLSLLPLFQSR